ncbi:steroidogenic acute regulatory protein, mitochondrial [Genypterus blacodes]|uniref:steroidogenic acute regulatory protein, mitochondrial n=1 Tax=Genypterus blacodes TaxID=154954 RepID=UPI003F772E8E
MLPAVVKLCCGISYPHLRNMAGLQRTAVAVIGQEITHLQHMRHIQSHMGMDAVSAYREPRKEDRKTVPAKDKQMMSIQQQGQEAMRKALDILEDKDGWTTETTERNGDVICSKVINGDRRVFRLEADLDASMEELYDILFVKVEEMHQWNPSIQHIKVLKHVGPETIVTHEASAQTAGNLIGQRDFLSVRHSCKHKSCIYLGGAAIQLECFPPQKGVVRAEDGPTCIIIKPLDKDSRRSRFTWLLNLDVKGWLPISIVNQALPRAQLDFTQHLRTRLTLGTTLG